MKNILYAFLSFFTVLGSSNTYGEIPKSFSTTVDRMFQSVNYGVLNSTMYCGCSIMADRNVRRSDCRYTPTRDNTRSWKVEAEHVFPVSSMGAALACWGEGRRDIKQCYSANGELLPPRKCCEKVNRDYELAQNDLVNLVPVIGQLNLDRGNKPFTMIPGESRVYGQCDVEVTPLGIEPREEVRGDIARIYFYMLYTYGGRLGFDITGDIVSHLYYWDIKDPISAKERIRNERICAAQGSANDLVGRCE